MSRCPDCSHYHLRMDYSKGEYVKERCYTCNSEGGACEEGELNEKTKKLVRERLHEVAEGKVMGTKDLKEKLRKKK